MRPRDVVNTMGLDACPASFLDIGSNLSKLICRCLASPVGFYGLLDLAILTYSNLGVSVWYSHRWKPHYRCGGNRER
jgi:hypothetical protein